MSKKLKKKILRVCIGAVVFAAGVAVSYVAPEGTAKTIAEYALFICAYLIIGFNVLKNAVLNIAHARFLDENFLMTIASLGAFAVGESMEAVAVMLFYQVGECFQAYAVGRSRKSITSLMSIRPDSANVERDGEIVTVEPSQVSVGEVIVVKPGELVPLDGVVISGETALDTKALTGESMPVNVETGSEILSGSVNLNGLIRVEVSGEYAVSTVAKILDLVENQTAKKAKTENFITKFAKVYTPIVVGLAVALAVIPPLVTALFAGGSIGDPALWKQWVYRALTFLVVSCPCALVISIPLSFFGGLGGAGKKGILIKGTNYLEALAQTDIVVMDKTGTLTEGSFSLSKVCAVGMEESELLKYLAYAESSSLHPIAKSVVKAYNADIDNSLISEFGEFAGNGVRAIVEGKEILAGNEKLMRENGISFTPTDETGTVIYTCVNGNFAGYVVISDKIKADTYGAVKQLRQLGVSRLVMLTGDNEKTAKSVAEQLSISEYHASLLPADKVEQVEKLMREKGDKQKLVFVGDGINDAPVLAGADVGIAMGGVGSDAAIEASDVVIMTDELSKIVTGIKISHRTLKIVKENIIFAIGVKVLILLLAALGFAGMWAAVFGDVGVAVIAILNAMRCLKVKE